MAPSGVTGMRYILFAPGATVVGAFDVGTPSCAELPPPLTSTPGVHPGGGTPSSQAGSPA